jgi:Domain of unknown function (DUF3471)
VPEAKLGLTVLSNLGSTQFPSAVVNGLIDVLLDLPRRDWNTLRIEEMRNREAEVKASEREWEEKRHQETKPSREYTAYTGRYEEPAYGTASVTLESGALALQWSSFHWRLEHFHYNTFVTRDANTLDNELLTFALAPDGEVAMMSFLGQEFRKP